MPFQNNKYKPKLTAGYGEAHQLLENYSMFSSSLAYTEIDLKGKKYQTKKSTDKSF